jgi:hypothetical protein
VFPDEPSPTSDGRRSCPGTDRARRWPGGGLAKVSSSRPSRSLIRMRSRQRGGPEQSWLALQPRSSAWLALSPCRRLRSARIGSPAKGQVVIGGVPGKRLQAQVSVDDFDLMLASNTADPKGLRRVMAVRITTAVRDGERDPERLKELAPSPTTTCTWSAGINLPEYGCRLLRPHGEGSRSLSAGLGRRPAL